MSEYISVTTTVDSPEAAERIAKLLLERRLAACVQIDGPCESIYRWNGALERSREWRCTIKTRAELYPDLERRLRAAHPYETPEILAHTIERGNADYLDWIDDSVRR